MSRDFQVQDGDLVIRDGDFVVSESAQQEVEHLLIAEKGMFKQHPQLGIGIRRQLGRGLTGALKRNIRLQLEADGKKLRSVTGESGDIKIDFE